MRYKEERTGIIIIIILWMMILIPIIVSSLTNSIEVIAIFSLIGFGLFITLIFFPSLLKTIKIKNKYKNIVENGIRVNGDIVDYSVELYSSGDEHERDCKVTVRYIDPYTNEEKSIITPPLSFDAISDLGSKSCSVYILNESYYVTDFIPRKKSQENIWGSNIDKYEQKELKKLKVFLILFLTIFIIVTLACFGLFL